MSSNYEGTGLGLVKMWDDFEIGGRIYCQLCHLSAQNILNDKKDAFFSHAMSVMHKLTATKYHLDNYKRIENERYQYFQKQFRKRDLQLAEEFGLIFEIEAFLHQIKSSLDMLVKLIDPIIGAGTVGTHTFGDKGEKVIRGLEQYKLRKGSNREMADHLISLIRDDQRTWLEYIVSIRDEFSHTTALQKFRFEPAKLSNGEVIPQKPKLKGTETLPLLETAYSNNLGFHQDFMCLSLAMAFPMFGLVPVDRSKPLGFQNCDQYIKWAWSMRNPAAPGVD